MLPCRLIPLDHGYWHRYEQHVGGFHMCQFDAALLDGNELLTHLQNEQALEREAHWLHMVLDQLEGTRESMRHRIAAPAPLVLDFWVEAAMLDHLKERLARSLGENQQRQVNDVREMLWLSAARCAAVGADEHAAEVAACLRSVRLLTSGYLPQFPMRLLPESPWRLLVPVDVPPFSNPSDHFIETTTMVGDPGIRDNVLSPNPLVYQSISGWCFGTMEFYDFHRLGMENHPN